MPGEKRVKPCGHHGACGDIARTLLRDAKRRKRRAYEARRSKGNAKLLTGLLLTAGVIGGLAVLAWKSS